MDASLATAARSLYHEKRKRLGRNGAPNKKQRFERNKKPGKEGGAEEILEMDVRNLLASKGNTSGSDAAASELPEPFTKLELEVSELSSIGDGLALHDGRAYVVPFSLPGDRILAKVIRHLQTHTVTDFLSVVRPSLDRDDSLIGCKYFGSCSGCQLQMLSYPKQLEHKKRVIEKAYDHFSDLPEDVLPPIGQTIGSPLQYAYRTKLTPHFDGPRRGGFKATDVVPEIGFNIKGQRKVLDIEDCPIGVESVRNGITMQRKFVHDNLTKYKRGATLLLRESTNRTLDGEDLAKFTEEKLCITDPNATSTEYIDFYKFISPAGAFFQNNNSILPTFTSYIRNNLSLVVPTDGASKEPLRYLVDAYCGSGLFTVTCGSSVLKAIGVDISADSITYASRNAVANNITNASFIAGNAEKIFADIDFPGAETSCIIDPPRKGCDHLFLDQLLEFNPKKIVYVSCNVHTQARDVDYILKKEKGKGYKVDSIRGFDFFPQTHHVESVVVLTWVESVEGSRR
ncbi:S-adenosyl-L-methionine-dependent methyltransferase [Trichophaea hybrida]|nr:S-adenosyl-L-methionine-dependent methyltransferase [Trichophaea hybrida]